MLSNIRSRWKKYRLQSAVLKILKSEGVIQLWQPHLRSELSPVEPVEISSAEFGKICLRFKNRIRRKADSSPSSKPGAYISDKSVDVLSFVSTHNQLAALRSIIENLQPDLTSRLAISRFGVFDTLDFEPLALEECYSEVQDSVFSFFDEFQDEILTLASMEVPSKPEAILEVILNIFLAIFLLNSTRPKFVLLANDHSSRQRCLISVAHAKNIKTGYVQHASVSSKFPRLDFDYAFLDGMSAVETYAKCRFNSSSNSKIKKNPEIYLTGQQKYLSISQASSESIGVAINKIDNIKRICEFVEELSQHDFSIVMRWHPRQGFDDITFLTSFVDGSNSNISLSNPNEESVEKFILRVGTVVAGDSSILLEAAIGGCLPYYFRTSEILEWDYYGFVGSGLVSEIECVNDLKKGIVCGTGVSADERRKEAIKHFSETYGSSNFGKEGILVASTIKAILTDKVPPNFEAASSISPFDKVYQMKLED